MLDHAIAVAREERKPEESDADHRDAACTIENVAIVVAALAEIADPLARDTIMTAFDEGLVTERIITRRDAERHYDTTRKLSGEFTRETWLDAYRVDYEMNAELNTPVAPAPRCRQVWISGSLQRRRTPARYAGARPHCQLRTEDRTKRPLLVRQR